MLRLDLLIEVHELLQVGFDLLQLSLRIDELLLVQLELVRRLLDGWALRRRLTHLHGELLLLRERLQVDPELKYYFLDRVLELVDLMLLLLQRHPLRLIHHHTHLQVSQLLLDLILLGLQTDQTALKVLLHLRLLLLLLQLVQQVLRRGMCLLLVLVAGVVLLREGGGVRGGGVLGVQLGDLGLHRGRWLLLGWKLLEP